MKTIVVPQEITEMCIIPVKKCKVGHLLLVALCDGKNIFFPSFLLSFFCFFIEYTASQLSLSKINIREKNQSN